MKRMLLGAGIIALSLGAWAAITSQQPVSKTVGEVKSYQVDAPPSFTEEDFRTFASAVANGNALPPGWTLTASEGQIKAIDTGMRLVPSYERLWTVTVVDDAADIQSVIVSINDVIVATATRQNGKIIDRSGMGIATLGIVVPPEGQPWQGKVEWTADDGTVRSFDGPLGL